MIDTSPHAPWETLRYHPRQNALWRTRARFCSVYAGRGSGKTVIARRRVIRFLPVRKPWSDPMYFYALPTRDQAERVAWPILKKLVPREWLDGVHNPISESKMTITTRFGSTLWLLGMDKPARAEGVQWDGGVVDESCDQKPGVFDLSLRPALSHKKAWCWRIGVPKRTGSGAREFREFCQLGESGADPEVETFTWPSSDIMTPEEIASAKRQLDEKDYREQYEASWETVGGLIFYAFDSALNVDSDIAYNPALPLLVGSDFNVDPMAWVVAQHSGGELRILDEIWLRSTNTEATLGELHRRYPNHASGWRFYGDATGKNRHTSASMSDYTHIRSDSRFKDARVMYPSSNPPRHDRFAACNAMFKLASGERRTKVHPKCKHLIKDLENRAYQEGTTEPDTNDPDSGHITDALGYLIYTLFPLRIANLGRTPEVGSM